MAQSQNGKTQQPQATLPMGIGTSSSPKNVKNLPFNTDGNRAWSHGLLDCFGDCDTCVCALFCPCMVYAKNKKRVDYLNYNGRPDPEEGGTGIDENCAMYFCLASLFDGGFILQMFNRGIVRKRYSIEGDIFKDCLAAYACRSCQLTQESREIELEEQSLRS